MASIKECVVNIQKILVGTERIPIDLAKDINNQLKIIVLLAEKQEDKNRGK